MQLPRPLLSVLRPKLRESDAKIVTSMRHESRKADNYFGRHAAQLPVLGREGQERLRQAHVHVSGTGRIGGSVTIHLASAGLGHLSANDPQNVEPENLGASAFARPSDLGQEKVMVLWRYFQGQPDL